MTWGKYVIISLGLMLVTHLAQARDIDSFTDSQGTLHITNLGSAKSKRPANLPNPAASLPSGHLLGQTPVTPPARALAPAVQAPAPKPGPAPALPIPVAPQRGSRVTYTEGSSGVMEAAGQTGGQDEPGIAAGVTRASLQRVSWTPPEPGRPSSNGKIASYRDSHGVIHITNVPREGEEPATPVTPAPVAQTMPPGAALPIVRQVSCPVPVLAQKQLWPPGPAPPAVRQVACPELGPEVADYLEAKLLAQAPALTGKTIQRYKDLRGVWHIGNEPAPAPQLPQAQVAAATEPITAPASVQGPPGPPTPPGLAGWLRPRPGAPDQEVVARRDRRGIVHIFTCASPGAMPDQGSPLYFLGKLSPVLQACIVEAAQQYRLPVSLVLAIIRKESDFSCQAVSPKGAMGLMQLMPGTAASLGVRDPFDPRENILAGCRYFRSLLDYFQGNVPLALAGYNAGSHRVISAGFQVPAIKETQAFVTQVMGLYYLLEKRADSL
jgi:soluble lytic murein transglycosylase-like protein